MQITIEVLKVRAIKSNTLFSPNIQSTSKTHRYPLSTAAYGKGKEESGYEIRKRHYRSTSCEGCPLKERCTKATGNREVVVSLERLRYQKQAREILQSEEGYHLAVRRMTEPESVFGQLKNNRGFRRFWRCGIEKVTLEVGWLSLAHNLLKQAANDQKRRAAVLQ
ncbi:hypothetical protein GCM10010912_64180 [Paenibacillus albidus]|uniref:Transposase DDE domain-containing protein n=1 Tax=Paenibacillus albidus TaxID=2041023 RepID=A0A917FXG4_9BACL|nr:hypothetical protein GCM10010912_64180 [Paenibacillus albidus]